MAMQTKFEQLQQYQNDQPKNRILGVNERNYGNCIIISRDKNGQPRLCLGPHYYIFIASLLALSSLFVFLIWTMRDHLTIVWFWIVIICAATFAISYINIGLSVPGFASTRAQPTEDQTKNSRFCKPCKIIRQRNVYHCYDCDVCITDYDHHCPWIGKCVGRQNLCSFYFFLAMTFGSLLLVFVATLASNMQNQNDQKNLRTDDDKSFIVKT